MSDFKEKTTQENISQLFGGPFEVMSASLREDLETKLKDSIGAENLNKRDEYTYRILLNLNYTDDEIKERLKDIRRLPDESRVSRKDMIIDSDRLIVEYADKLGTFFEQFFMTGNEDLIEPLKSDLQDFVSIEENLALRNIFNPCPVSIKNRERIIKLKNFISDTIFYGEMQNKLESFAENRSRIKGYTSRLEIATVLPQRPFFQGFRDIEIISRLKSMESMLEQGSRREINRQDSVLPNDLIGLRIYFETASDIEKFLQSLGDSADVNLVHSAYRVREDGNISFVSNGKENIGNLILQMDNLDKKFRELSSNAVYMGANLNFLFDFTRFVVPCSMQLCLKKYSKGDWYQHFIYEEEKRKEFKNISLGVISADVDI